MVYNSLRKPDKKFTAAECQNYTQSMEENARGDRRSTLSHHQDFILIGLNVALTCLHFTVISKLLYVILKSTLRSKGYIVLNKYHPISAAEIQLCCQAVFIDPWCIHHMVSIHFFCALLHFHALHVYHSQVRGKLYVKVKDLVLTTLQGNGAVQ